MLIHILSPACLSSHSVTTSPHSLTASPISICQMLHPLWGPHGHPPSQVIPLLPRIRVLCQYLHDSASPSCVYRVHPRCKKGGKNWTWTQESGCEPCHCENWADTSSFLPGLSQGIKEVHVQNIQHRDSPELMVSHYFLDEQLHSNDVFGFVLKIIWQLAWELVPSTLWTFFESILNTICHCLGIFFFRYSVYKDPAGWLNINPINGTVDTTAVLDRESPFVHNSVYTAIFLAIDSGEHIFKFQ